jgi:hypothetical protein
MTGNIPSNLLPTQRHDRDKADAEVGVLGVV